MTVVEIAHKLQVELPEGFRFSEYLEEVFSANHYRHKGKRIRRVSLFLQVFGFQSVVRFANYMGMAT